MHCLRQVNAAVSPSYQHNLVCLLQAFQLLGFQAAKDLIPYTDIIKRQTVRVWDFDNNVPTNPRTIQLPGAQGVIDVKVRGGWVGL